MLDGKAFRCHMDTKKRDTEYIYQCCILCQCDHCDGQIIVKKIHIMILLTTSFQFHELIITGYLLVSEGKRNMLQLIGLHNVKDEKECIKCPTISASIYVYNCFSTDVV